MGNRNRDNLTRRLNREGKALWELDREPELQPAEPCAFAEPQARQQVSDIAAARQRVEQLEQQQHDCARSVIDTRDAYQATCQQISDCERQLKTLQKQLKELRSSAQKQQGSLQHQQVEQNNQQLMLETARSRLQALEQAFEQGQQQLQQQVQQQTQQQPSSGLQVHGDGSVAAGMDVFSRHRDNPVTPQARAMPLAEDYLPAEWCFQKLQQHNGLTRDYAMQQLEDFKMYWLSTGEARKAWDYRFIKHVIYQWQREQGERRTHTPRTTEEKLADQSWADGPFLDFED